MKMLLFVFLITLFAGLFLPLWWAFIPLVCLAGFGLGKSISHAALCGFLGAGSCWLLAALFLQWYSHGSITQRMTPLFGLPHCFPLFVIVFLGPAVLSAGAACVGYRLKQAIPVRRK